ncbi:Protein MICROTUBULE BINDING PROTEIN 2C [Datura stramonium]|uniref:Protein MICROTUBULE BINDING PROTEIN 2C n=1 Tax=Datura stramonium TaxID=4076 RepID=A0ABS8V8H0_DATST|nr:Protein MICROTUBULE BINDING PROTEIN 2C [Datura stramonium]
MPLHCHPCLKAHQNQTRFNSTFPKLLYLYYSCCQHLNSSPTMYEQQQQQLFDLQDNNGAFDNGADPSSWLSRETPRIDSSLSVAPTGNVDPFLFNDLVQIVPLVQSLIDRKAKTSFSRRGSMTYTKMPSRESLYKKVFSRSIPFI